MAFYIAEGATLPLSIQLFDYDPNKFVKAFITDSNNDPIAGSPVELAPVGSLGFYSNNTLVMPNTPFVVVQYVVYDDSGYTTVSTSEGGASDTFILDSLSTGDGIPTYIQLFNYDPAKFIRAYVTDDSNNPVSGSPVALVPIGSLGLYGSADLLAPASPFVVAQYIVYDDAGYTIVSTSQGAASETFLISVPAGFMDNGNLPYVGDTMLDYFQPMVFTQIQKTTTKNFQVMETPTNIAFRGVWQPFGAQHLAMKPHGQRRWAWFMLHSDPSLSLTPDEVVTYHNIQYRVMERLDYTRYGYMEYHVIEDYTGSGPN